MIVLLTLAVAAAEAAPAQSLVPSTQAQRHPRRLRAGPFRLGPVRLTPRLELRNAGVDTNVYNSQTRRVSDTEVVFRPSLEAAAHAGRRLRLRGAGHLDLNYFRLQSSERSTGFGAEGLAELDLGPFTFFGGGGGAQGKQRVAFDLDDRVLRQDEWVQGGATLGAGHRLWLTAVGSEHVFRFGQPRGTSRSLAEVLDRNERALSLQARLSLTRQTTLVGSAEAIEDLFLSQQEGNRTVRSVRYLGGVEFGEYGLLNGRLLFGVREFPSSRVTGVPSYRGPAVSVSTALPLFNRGRLMLRADRDVSYAAAPTRTALDTLRNTYLRSHLGADVAVELPFDLIGRAFSSLEQARYVLPYVRGTSFVRRADRVWRTGGTLLYRPSDTVRVGATAAYTRRLSNFEGLSYDGWRYGLQAELVP